MSVKAARRRFASISAARFSKKLVRGRALLRLARVPDQDHRGRPGKIRVFDRGPQRLAAASGDDRSRRGRAVFGANISRLSRRVIDFELFRLRAACHNTLLYLDGRFINPADSNDTFISQITAMVAQYDNRIRAELMMQGKLAKAKRGEMVSRLPLGWTKGPDRRYAYDPNVKDTILKIIETFRRTRSVARTVRHSPRRE